MDNYRPNSHKAKAETITAEKKANDVKKVVKAPVKVKKKNELRKLSDIFIAEDASNVKSYVFMDVIVPAIKNALYDVVVGGVGMMLGKGPRGGKQIGGLTERTSYGSFYNSGREYEAPKARTTFNIEGIEFKTRGDAELVLDALFRELANYTVVRVSDFYEFAGLTAPYTANDYGWTRLSSAEVVRGRDGYYIKMPRPMSIER